MADLNHWSVKPSSYRMSREHNPVVLYYDPNPGGTKHDDGTTSHSLIFPALAFTEWVSEPEKVAQSIADALNQTKLKKAVAVIETMLKLADEAREEWDKAPSTMKAGKLLIAMIDPSLHYRSDITAMHETIAMLKKED